MVRGFEPAGSWWEAAAPSAARRRSTNCAKCWHPPRLRTGLLALHGMTLTQVNYTPWSWQILCSQQEGPQIQGMTPFPGGQHEGQRHQQSQFPPIMWALGLPRAQACTAMPAWFTSMVTIPFLAIDLETTQIQGGLFLQKVWALDPSGRHVLLGWMGRLCAQTLGAAVWDVEELDTVPEFPNSVSV